MSDAKTLHDQIMNLQCRPYDCTTTYDAYCKGYREARHDAATIATLALRDQPPSVPQLTGPVYDHVMFTDGWQLFVCYLIDKCEGETVTEEMLGRTAAAFLRDPKYSQGMKDATPSAPSSSQQGEADAARLDWLERQATNGVHVECCHSGSFSGANLQRVCTVFMHAGTYKADTLRAAIDAARASLESAKSGEVGNG